MGSESTESQSGSTIPPQHTLGPWRVIEAGGFWVVPGVVAFDHGTPDVTIIPVPLDSEANATLIAAAPDLLAALKWATEMLWEFDAANELTAHLRFCRGAIAKAEGRDAE